MLRILGEKLALIAADQCVALLCYSLLQPLTSDKELLDRESTVENFP